MQQQKKYFLPELFLTQQQNLKFQNCLFADEAELDDDCYAGMKTKDQEDLMYDFDTYNVFTDQSASATDSNKEIFTESEGEHSYNEQANDISPSQLQQENDDWDTVAIDGKTL